MQAPPHLFASRRSWMVTAAIPVLLATPWAGAQARVGSDGHANDANNQLGGSGYNSAGFSSSGANGRSVPNTQLNPGSDTGLSRFHGPVDTFDPNVVQANTGDASVQNFLSRSAPPTYTGPTTGSQNYTPYYDPQTYVGRASSLAPSALPQVGQATDPNDTRLPAIGSAPRGAQASITNPAGQAASGGTAAPQFDASPLFGVRQLQVGEPAPAERTQVLSADRAMVAMPAAEAAEPIVPPAMQSAQIGELERRFSPGKPVGNADRPFVITSLAAGIKDAGLAKLLRDAEGQMRAGAFGRSVETYDAAGALASNNPFAPLGRGFAELGAGYYGKAEADLTRAILAEPALLAAQYDLKEFLGADRLKYVQADLTDIAATEQTARPYLLLAYVAHNTGADDATVTARDLDVAASRGANPKLVGLMREAWDLMK